MLLTYIKF